jgi:hypothetical protein
MVNEKEKTNRTDRKSGYVLRCKKCDGVLAAFVADAEGVDQTIPRWRKRDDAYVELHFVEDARSLPLCDRVSEGDGSEKEKRGKLGRKSHLDQEWISQVPKRPQRQDGTSDQLRDLKAVANRLGMYDAADLITEIIS